MKKNIVNINQYVACFGQIRIFRERAVDVTGQSFPCSARLAYKIVAHESVIEGANINVH